MKAVIIYQSHRGKTAGYARQMAMYLWQQGFSVSLCATSDFRPGQLEHCDVLLLGCWTSGWFFFHQHPNDIWVNFARKHLQGPLPPRLMLFTTYKIRTGSMFRKMKKELNLQQVVHLQTLRSRSGFLSDADKATLLQLVHTPVNA